MPPELGNLTNFGYLQLDVNQLTGAIPGELGNLSGLQYLDFSYTGLTGPIPEELNCLPSNTQIILVNTDLTGPLPGGLPGRDTVAFRSFQIPCPDYATSHSLGLEARWTFLGGQ